MIASKMVWIQVPFPDRFENHCLNCKNHFRSWDGNHLIESEIFLNLDSGFNLFDDDDDSLWMGGEVNDDDDERVWVDGWSWRGWLRSEWGSIGSDGLDSRIKEWGLMRMFFSGGGWMDRESERDEIESDEDRWSSLVWARWMSGSDEMIGYEQIREMKLKLKTIINFNILKTEKTEEDQEQKSMGVSRTDSESQPGSMFWMPTSKSGEWRLEVKRVLEIHEQRPKSWEDVSKDWVQDHSIFKLTVCTLNPKHILKFLQTVLDPQFSSSDLGNRWRKKNLKLNVDANLANQKKKKKKKSWDSITFRLMDIDWDHHGLLKPFWSIDILKQLFIHPSIHQTNYSYLFYLFSLDHIPNPELQILNLFQSTFHTSSFITFTLLTNLSEFKFTTFSKASRLIFSIIQKPPLANFFP